jgi:outer membrane lipoprotein-sorting protein
MISMRPTTLAALGLTLAFAAPRPALAQDAQKGAALMAEARKAIGGDDKLRAVKTLESKGTLKRTAGNNTQEADVEVLIELPGKYRRNELSGFAGGPTQERVEVLNGQDVWDINAAGGGFGGGFGRGGFGGGRRGDGGRGFGGGGQGQPGQADPGQPNPGQANGRGAQAIDPERLKELQRRQRQTELARLTLMWLLTTDAPVTWVGTAESPDGNADVLEVKADDGPATRVFLDAATHMPLMLTTTAGGGRGQFGRRGGGADAPAPQGAPGGASPQGAPDSSGAPQAPGGAPRRGGPGAAGQPITIETHLSEYKAVNGIKLPHLITRGINGQTNEEWEIKSFKINPSLKASTFTK